MVKYTARIYVHIHQTIEHSRFSVGCGISGTNRLSNEDFYVSKFSHNKSWNYPMILFFIAYVIRECSIPELYPERTAALQSIQNNHQLYFIAKF
jgi:hypothetical protein